MMEWKELGENDLDLEIERFLREYKYPLPP